MVTSLKRRSQSCIVLGIALFCFCSPRVSHADTTTVIYSDHFSGPDGSNDGRTPDTIDLPGATWQQTGGYFGNTQISGGALSVPSIGGTALSTASAGQYTKPTNYTISADLEVGNLNYGGNPSGIGLGFWNALHPGGGSLADYYGLLMDQSGGISLTNATTTYESVAWAGPAFSTSQEYTVTYSVNTTTGAISNVSVSGSTADYSAIDSDANGLFTAANTAYAGVRADAGNPGRNGLADNFVLSTDAATPEPGTVAIVVSFGVTAVGVLRRRSASAKA